MCTALNNATVVKYDNNICVSNRRKTVSNNKGGAVVHQSVHTTLDNCFSTCVNAGGSFVQNHDGWICNRSAGNGDELALSLGEGAAVVLKHSVVTLWKTSDKVIGTSKFCGLHAVLISSIKTAVADVIQDGTCKEVDVLQNNTESTTKSALPNLVNVDAVVANLAVFNVIEAVEQVSNGCFTSTCCANKGNLLTRFCIKRNIMQHGVARLVAKVNIKEANVSLNRGVSNRAVTVWILPSPVTGAVLGFLNFTVNGFCVD